ncbi:galactose mutarotase [Lachnospiraceae bacterium MD1]|jgi:aldose 1-epimerase|uniref:Aldose 1-epimerase n=1 Tax=Variimorphobacter saccharofermentans TaxID=2755051 RepID=A0A839K4B3_9FIRM|nr:aldose epimerase family protein [Variimorphobacter saccharofermentans]MBB2183879.1 galactose mutarotase [Variimorphobacter saccharofermentans]
MEITQKSFGKTSKGEEATLFTITNSNGMKVSLTNYGANVVSIIVPDKNGNFTDVALGFENIAGYEENGPGFGSFIGRHANRIGGAKFELNGKVYELDKNDGENNLHSGFLGYNKVMYDAEYYEDGDIISVEFSRLSPHMEQGFPGNLDVSVTYSLTEDNELVIEYHAVSDKDTIVNFTNHSYFNLSGHDSGSILDHKVWIKANQFTPTDDGLIPTGELRDVSGTPMDFRTIKRIGQDIDADYEPLKLAGGYDHNYVLDISGAEVEKVAELIDDRSGRVMEVFTDLPGMQFYSGNFMQPVNNSKDGAVYQKRYGVCFETQYFPNSCNIPSFPSCVLKAGKEFDSVTIYKFLTTN